MQAVRRLTGGDPGMIVDAWLGIVAAGLTVAAAWGPPGLIGTTISGPSWLLALLPLLIGAPLVVRRRAPLLTWTAVFAIIGLQSLLASGQYAESLRVEFGPNPRTPVAFTFALFAAAYSLGRTPVCAVWRLAWPSPSRRPWPASATTRDWVLPSRRMPIRWASL